MSGTSSRHLDVKGSSRNLDVTNTKPSSNHIGIGESIEEIKEESTETKKLNIAEAGADMKQSILNL